MRKDSQGGAARNEMAIHDNHLSVSALDGSEVFARPPWHTVFAFGSAETGGWVRWKYVRDPRHGLYEKLQRTPSLISESKNYSDGYSG